MPRLRPMPATASAPISEDHTGDREEDLRLADEVELPALRCSSASWTPSTDGRSRPLPAAEQTEDRRGHDDGGEERDDRSDTEGGGESTHAGGGEHEEDERGDDRDDVGVENRREALASNRSKSPIFIDFAGTDLFLYSLEDDDVGVGRHRERQHETGDSRQREGEADELRHREEEDPVEDQRDAGDDAEQAVENQQEQGRRAGIRRPSRSAPGRGPRLPSDAEICVSEISSSSTGSAPRSICFEMRMASDWVRPVICARPPAIPSLSVPSVGSMLASETTLPSSTIAKRCAALTCRRALALPGPPRRAPW